jgi:chromosome segregation ATPase
MPTSILSGSPGVSTWKDRIMEGQDRIDELEQLRAERAVAARINEDLKGDLEHLRTENEALRRDLAQVRAATSEVINYSRFSTLRDLIYTVKRDTDELVRRSDKDEKVWEEWDRDLEQLRAENEALKGQTRGVEPRPVVFENITPEEEK